MYHVRSLFIHHDHHHHDHYHHHHHHRHHHHHHHHHHHRHHKKIRIISIKFQQQRRADPTMVIIPVIISYHIMSYHVMSCHLIIIIIIIIIIITIIIITIIFIHSHLHRQPNIETTQWRWGTFRTSSKLSFLFLSCCSRRKESPRRRVLADHWRDCKYMGVSSPMTLDI